MHTASDEIHQQAHGMLVARGPEHTPPMCSHACQDTPQASWKVKLAQASVMSSRIQKQSRHASAELVASSTLGLGCCALSCPSWPVPHAHSRPSSSGIPKHVCASGLVFHHKWRELLLSVGMGKHSMHGEGAAAVFVNPEAKRNRVVLLIVVMVLLIVSASRAEE